MISLSKVNSEEQQRLHELVDLPRCNKPNTGALELPNKKYPPGLKKSARLRSERAMQRALVALSRMEASDREVNFRAVATEAGVSTTWLYSQEALRGRIMRSRRIATVVTLPASASRDRERVSRQNVVATLRLRIKNLVLKATVEQVREKYAFSQRRACGVMKLAATTCRYQSRRRDEPLRTKLVELARAKPRFGYRRLHVLLRRSGEHVNHKRLHRIYREAGLTIRRKKRKHCVREGKPLLARTSANQEWALDFVHDAVGRGRTIRVLSVVDAYTRECLALEADTSSASRRVTRVLEAIVAERGQPLQCEARTGEFSVL